MDETLKLFVRLKETSDGIQLLEFLETLSKQNYEAWKKCPSEFNDVHKGQSIAIDSLINFFETSADKLARIEMAPKEWL